MEKIFFKNYKKLSKNNAFLLRTENDEIFSSYFNNNTSNFQQI